MINGGRNDLWVLLVHEDALTVAVAAAADHLWREEHVRDGLNEHPEDESNHTGCLIAGLIQLDSFA